MGFFDRFKKTKDDKKKIKSEKVEKKKETTTIKPKAEIGAPISLKAKKEIKTNKVQKDDTKNAYRILIGPVVTEKATDLVSENKYEFEVADCANKIEIKKAIKSVYGFEPLNVNIVKVRGKRASYGRIEGKRKNWKKAIVTLKKGEKIEIYEGV
ncbi:50S ribosomal protein L23 [Candidatus Falkowbacteria bacterium]|nr:50S ribosomal protein L23 [Candidatus Falkowbacteria bacterium]